MAKGSRQGTKTTCNTSTDSGNEANKPVERGPDRARYDARTADVGNKLNNWTGKLKDWRATGLD